ncbi:MAG: hypothetical protein HC927_01530 [Deltaproteobacteria bacterium]|nr:hypothetical protein [Deltaproteobacteria bacterium]
MRTRWLAPFTISLGLSSALAIAACKNDDGGEDQADGGSESESDASTTETGTTNSTTETDDTETDDTTTDDTDTTTGCTPGELGCDCNNGLCLGDLECVAGTCVNSECIPRRARLRVQQRPVPRRPRLQQRHLLGPKLHARRARLRVQQRAVSGGAGLR